MTRKPTDDKSALHPASPAVTSLKTRIGPELDKLMNQPGGNVADLNWLLAANRQAALVAGEALLGLDSRSIVRAQLDNAADQVRSIAGGGSMSVLAADQLRTQAPPHAFEIGTDHYCPVK